MSSVTKYASHVQTPKSTPQSQPIPGSTQVQNSAGGYSWQVDCWTRLDRFLILGNEGGSYYAGERKMTQQAASCIQECFAQDPVRTVNRIVEVSDKGLAPKNDPAIFALALLSNHKIALDAVPLVCRIGTHIFQFVSAASKLRGWGPSLRKAVARWYTEKEARDLAYQVTKYQNREGWTHHDVLHKCHAKPFTEAHLTVHEWVKNKKLLPGAPELLGLYNEIQTITDEKQLCRIISEHRIDRELLPTQWLNSPRVWEAMLPHMKLTALIRNLGKMSAVGLLVANSPASREICSRIVDKDGLRKARVHPIALLLAGKVYQSGRGVKGSLSWNTVGKVTESLDEAFYEAFHNVTPTGKRFLLGLDVSGSMGCGSVAGTPMTPREASGAMAMLTVRTEELVETMAFGHTFHKLNLHKRQSLNDVITTISGLPFGGTDCALPMKHALEHKIPVDVFVVYSDNETWAGIGHPSQALKEYRQKMGINAKLIVCGMVSNQFTIADPNDAGMLDVVGFSADVPQVMSSFITG